MPRYSLLLTCVAIGLTLAADRLAAAAGGLDLQPAPIDRVPAGLDFTEAPPAGWTHLPIVATLSISSGDTGAASGLVSKYAQMFGTVVMASVDRNQAGAHRLGRVAIGVMIPWRGAYRTVDAKSQEIGFVGRQAMPSIIKKLDAITRVARYDSAVVFDVPALMADDGRHVERVVRHFVWCSPKTGDLATAVWLIDASDPARRRLVEDSFVWMPSGYIDRRRLHVDGREFTLGIPGERAFAVESLPAADRAKFSPKMAEVAALAEFDKQTLFQLASELAKSIQAASPSE
ncbi:hypothetical protein Pla175_02370 [Pirellulimonas nuda]|uniref:Uncharacterized protein n=1 Tax=Pirellulimonas nuda TaxID=2528009 RepID=A0A518D5Y4_9BACT|nr:hypothetical protein [Pirellulimonas nuda]QDU86883.1 hypothetical protein Pla175_02370 [Pirellulimonas nuda]